MDKLKKRYQITATDEIGDSGRRRWRVVCMECTTEVHPATTGPALLAREHDAQLCSACATLEDFLAEARALSWESEGNGTTRVVKLQKVEELLQLAWARALKWKA